MFSLPKLRHIAALAEEGNFTRAAVRLGMTQPSLSRSIAEVERACGLRLFDRGRLGVTLTSAGSDLLRDARQILGRVDALEQNMKLQSRGIVGQVAMGIGPLAAGYVMERLLSECLLKWPSLRIIASIGSTEELIEGVIDGKLDFCICGTSDLDAFPMLSVRRIGAFKLGYFVRAEHPLAHAAAPLTWNDLAPFPRAAGKLQSSRDAPAPAIFGHLDTTVQCDEYDLLRRVMFQTDAIWLTSSRLLEAELADGRAREIHPDPQTVSFSADMAMVRLGGRSTSPALKGVMETATRLMHDS